MQPHTRTGLPPLSPRPAWLTLRCAVRPAVAMLLPSKSGNAVKSPGRIPFPGYRYLPAHGER